MKIRTPDGIPFFQHKETRAVQWDMPVDLQERQQKVMELKQRVARLSSDERPSADSAASPKCSETDAAAKRNDLEASSGKLPWNKLVRLSARDPGNSRVPNPALALMKTTAELDMALASWKSRVKAAGGDLRSTVNVTFAPQVMDARGLHDLAEAMGIVVKKDSAAGIATSGTQPPWATVTGDPVAQPALAVTWKLGPPQLTTTFQLN